MMTIEKTDKNPLLTRKELFWEINPNSIEAAFRENDDWVIVRVFEYGTLEDISDVIEFYGKEKTSEVLAREPLKPTAAAMAYLFLNVDRYGHWAFLNAPS